MDAVFSRRPSPDEVLAIHSAQTQEALVAAGFPSVTLRVSDRRLEIRNTTLDELEQGLSTVLADHLAYLTTQVRESQEAARKLIQDAAAAEGTRTDALAARASLIMFRPSSETT
ncbi:hypothetical protein [Microbacterium testaceum]|uniref:hypothetical protein n=1 Tax=Microbacterium testaceum TaxID=2033 RepID=UPI00124785F4|nr:hypothetical protein [Microbacterium testaceum]